MSHLIASAPKQPRIIGLVLAGACCGWVGAARGADEEPAPVDYGKLAKMSLEELMATEVTSVAGVGQEWFKTPAAMYVITNEDVRRTGHRSIAEALRLSPGVTVLNTDSNSWTVGTRGFNSGFANKQLVLIDGRTTYDFQFGGTIWDVQDVLLEDLDRIEVIRGPGATLWGANAVNGVINVTTRSAKDTQGFYAGGGGGNELRGFGEARYGFQIDDSSWARVWGKYANYDSFELPGPGDGHDDWDMARGGFRYDREGDDHGFLTVQGDIYNSDRLGEIAFRSLAPALINISDGRASGGNMLFRFGQEVPHADGWRVQGYYDRTERVGNNGLEVDRDTFDLDFRHHFLWGEINETIWGLGYRHTSDRTEPGFFVGKLGTLSYDPDDRSMDTFSGFIQDTVTIIPDNLFFMIGTKLEHNDMTGFEFQPSGRVWWTPSDRQTIWAAISRPVRTPSRTEDDLFAGVPPFFVVKGDTDSESERLLAYELGHRIKLTDSFNVDTAAYYNKYSNLATFDTISTSPFVLSSSNGGAAETYGVEVAATWQVASNWRLHGSYSFIEIHNLEPSNDNPRGATPQHQAQVRSALDITKFLEFNTALYYFDNIPQLHLEHYLRLDTGFTWHVTKNFDLAVWGQNLLDPRHPESGGPSGSAEVERAGYLMATVRF